MADDSLAELRRREREHDTTSWSPTCSRAGSRSPVRTINHPGNPVLLRSPAGSRDALGLAARERTVDRPLLDAVHAPREPVVAEIWGFAGRGPAATWWWRGAGAAVEAVRAAHLRWYADPGPPVAEALRPHAPTLARLLGLSAPPGSASRLSAPAHLVVPGTGHGVTGWRGPARPRHRRRVVDDPDRPRRRSAPVHVHVTDRLFGPSPEAAAELLVERSAAPHPAHRDPARRARSPPTAPVRAPPGRCYAAVLRRGARLGGQLAARAGHVGAHSARRHRRGRRAAAGRAPAPPGSARPGHRPARRPPPSACSAGSTPARATREVLAAAALLGDLRDARGARRGRRRPRPRRPGRRAGRAARGAGVGFEVTGSWPTTSWPPRLGRSTSPSPPTATSPRPARSTPGSPPVAGRWSAPAPTPGRWPRCAPARYTRSEDDRLADRDRARPWPTRLAPGSPGRRPAPPAADAAAAYLAGGAVTGGRAVTVPPSRRRHRARQPLGPPRRRAARPAVESAWSWPTTGSRSSSPGPCAAWPDRPTPPGARGVVVDDGSPAPPVVPDGVRLLRQDDRGFRAAAARNLGARHARGRGPGLPGRRHHARAGLRRPHSAGCPPCCPRRSPSAGAATPTSAHRAADAHRAGRSTTRARGARVAAPGATPPAATCSTPTNARSAS